MFGCSTGCLAAGLSPGLALTSRECRVQRREEKLPLMDSSRLFSLSHLSTTVHGHDNSFHLSQEGFFFLSWPTMTDYSIAARLSIGVVAIPHNGSCHVQQRRQGSALLRSMQFGCKIGHQSTMKSNKSTESQEDSIYCYENILLFV